MLEKIFFGKKENFKNVEQSTIRFVRNRVGVPVSFWWNFIELNNELENDSSVENHNFYLCSNLMRHLSGTNAREEQLIKYLNTIQ